MKPFNKRSEILWGISVIGLLGISYWLCRFVFFETHGMKDWPNVLATVSLIIIIIALIARWKRLSIATVVGYMGGFVFAIIFNIDGMDPGGGRTNNAWIIWSVVYIICALAGLIVDISYKKKMQ